MLGWQNRSERKLGAENVRHKSTTKDFKAPSVSAVQSSDWRHDMGVAGMETDLGFSYFLLASPPRLPTILLPQVTG